MTLTDEEIEACLTISNQTDKTQVWFTKGDVVEAIKLALWVAMNKDTQDEL